VTSVLRQLGDIRRDPPRLSEKFRQAKASFPQLARLKKDKRKLGNIAPRFAQGKSQGDRNAKIVRWGCLMVRPLL
jgi:hypothetical protein